MSAIGRLRISPSDIGRRITVRHLAGADLTDVLGHLVSWVGDWPTGVIGVRKKDESIQEIVTGKIFAAKVIEPEIGSLDLERDSESTWVPNETENLGDWVLRFSGNESARANSCRLDGRPQDSVDESLKKIVDWYRSLARELSIRDTMRTSCLCTQTCNLVLFIGFEVTFKPEPLRITFVSQDMCGYAVQEPTIVRDHNCATRKFQERIL